MRLIMIAKGVAEKTTSKIGTCETTLITYRFPMNGFATHRVKPIPCSAPEETPGCLGSRLEHGEVGRTLELLPEHREVTDLQVTHKIPHLDPLGDACTLEVLAENDDVRDLALDRGDEPEDLAHVVDIDTRDSAHARLRFCIGLCIGFVRPGQGQRRHAPCDAAGALVRGLERGHVERKKQSGAKMTMLGLMTDLRTTAAA